MTFGATDRSRVAIQGVRASFHDQAARKFILEGAQSQPTEIIECATFKSLCESLAEDDPKKRADFAIMAIENSIAGSILPNYALLEEYDFKITSETYLKIELFLMALRGQKISGIHTVYSHPMALLQCEEFFHRYPGIRRIEAADTAGSAQWIACEKVEGAAAIAGSLAAETYDLEILEARIETTALNYTRFLKICRARDYQPDPIANKSSLRFEVDHQPGRLARVLNALDQPSVNLTKIQSVPIPLRPYQYAFHIDVEWEDRAHYEIALSSARQSTLRLIELGEYRRGEWKSRSE